MNTEAATKLAEQLDGAKLVDYRPEIELVFAWFGGHGVNVYNARTGREEHYFNVGPTDGEEGVAMAEALDRISSGHVGTGRKDGPLSEWTAELECEREGYSPVGAFLAGARAGVERCGQIAEQALDAAPDTEGREGHDVELLDDGRLRKDYGRCKRCGKVGPPPYIAEDEWDDECGGKKEKLGELSERGSRWASRARQRR